MNLTDNKADSLRKRIDVEMDAEKRADIIRKMTLAAGINTAASVFWIGLGFKMLVDQTMHGGFSDLKQEIAYFGCFLASGAGIIGAARCLGKALIATMKDSKES